MISRFVTIFFMLLVSSCGLGYPALAVEPPADRTKAGVCVSFTYGMEILDASVPDLMFRMYEGDRAQHMVAVYNNTSPKTEFKADHVYIVTSKQRNLASIVLAIGDCVVDATATTPESATKFIAQALKDQA